MSRIASRFWVAILPPGSIALDLAVAPSMIRSVTHCSFQVSVTAKCAVTVVVVPLLVW